MSRLFAVLYSVIPAAVGVAAAGCAQLAGIQDTNGNGRPGDSVAVTRMSIGSKVVLAPLDPTGLTATYFVASGDPKSHAMKRHLWTLSETLVPTRHVFDFNQALMDFGATVCIARNPRCLICPMSKSCRAYPFTPGDE